MDAETAPIVAAWHDGLNAYLAVRVAEGGEAGDVEYIGQTALLKAEGGAKDEATLEAELKADVAARRARQLGAASALPVALPIAGTVVL